MENVIIYDAVSVTSRVTDPNFWIDFLGLSSLKWLEGKSRYYDHRLWSSTISIHYNDSDSESGVSGTWLEMMGQGCRTFEDLGTGDFDALFRLVLDDPDNFKITRLDIALDDHTGLLDLRQLGEDTRKQEYISKFREWEVREGSKGGSVNHGSDSSAFYLRIYDKAMERHCEDGVHWIRIEMQLRDDRADLWIRRPEPIGQRFSGVLRNYLRYIDPTGDSNRRRWPTKQYWDDLLGEAEKISLYVKPGIEYNLMRLNNFVFGQAGNPTAAAIEIYGVKTFLERLEKRGTTENPKYKKLVDQYAYMHSPAIPCNTKGSAAAGDLQQKCNTGGNTDEDEPEVHTAI